VQEQYPAATVVEGSADDVFGDAVLVGDRDELVDQIRSDREGHRRSSWLRWPSVMAAAYA
jgi:hypothetical protein